MTPLISATLTGILCRRWKRTFWASPRPINFSWQSYICILMPLCKKIFQHSRENRYFLILHGSVLTYAQWSETFWYCEVHRSFLVNLVQKLSILVKIWKKVVARVFMDDSVHSVLSLVRMGADLCSPCAGVGAGTGRSLLPRESEGITSVKIRIFYIRNRTFLCIFAWY